MKNAKLAKIIGVALAALLLALLLMFALHGKDDVERGIYGEELDIIQSEEEAAEGSGTSGKDKKSDKSSDTASNSGTANGTGGGTNTTGVSDAGNTESSDGSQGSGSASSGDNGSSSGGNESSSGSSSDSPIEQPDEPEVNSGDQQGSSGESEIPSSNDGIEPGHHENELPPVVI